MTKQRPPYDRNKKLGQRGKELIFHDNTLDLLGILGRKFPNSNVIANTKLIIDREPDINTAIDRICRELLKQRFDLKESVRLEAFNHLNMMKNGELPQDILAENDKRKINGNVSACELVLVQAMRQKGMTIKQIAIKLGKPMTTIAHHTRKNGWNYNAKNLLHNKKQEV
jgi:hypothetical protein